MPDGRKRDSVQFSITDEEWPEVRRALEERLKEPTAQPDDEIGRSPLP
jgi:hypothetical protein